ncbi:DNA polymerase III subunit delta' [Corynebacterium ammoniagenes]|uniref:DNA polymerase III, delta' subunit n=1 Tax=Corynebacterium ammoniagenes DSM 20306 TaxID=649754 RepID=A0ABP2IFB9_CORAM|nr:DNA polymerase III subunit delta' [Corynebacterium ammoniagenes]AQS72822.1 DNA polymerase III subunit delta' [Corynebacterium ammoniagenes]EFG82233.1 putative DNA polymerase III, delta' subunit [Corynebacterium ammoniagenes DSM 20306]
MGEVNEISLDRSSVAQRLADRPGVQQTILQAARAARGLPGADPRAMSHSWLFTGPPGSGRSHAALAFAAALMCTNVDDNGPDAELGCGQCDACRSVLETQSHVDLNFWTPQGLTIKVEEVRGVIKDAIALPTSAKYRVIIFDNADRLTAGASNALLKTVEEPSAQTIIIMCAPSADPQDFSQTLRSRCRHLYIPSPSVDYIVEQLVSEGASPNDAHLAALTSLQHVGRARRLVTNPDAQKRRAMAINLAEDVFHGSQAFQSTQALIKLVNDEAKSEGSEREEKEISDLEVAYGAGGKGKGTGRENRDLKSAVKRLNDQHKLRQTRRQRDYLDLVLVDLAGIYRDALMRKVGADVELTHPDFEGLADELAERVSEEGLLACQNAITNCREQMSHNVTQQIAFDGLVGRLRLACKTR